MHFGARIKELRERKNIDRNELAEKIGITYHALSKYETGDRQPDFATLGKFAEFFGVTTDYLLCRTDDPGVNDSSTSNPVPIAPANPDIAHISRAGKKMTPEEARKLREVAEVMFPHLFGKQ